MTTTEIKKGEVRLVNKTPDVIIKVVGPLDTETADEGVGTTKLDLYISTNEFPRYHYVVILGLIDSYTSPGNKFFLTKLVTHSPGFENLKITEDLFDKSSTTIDLTASYTTRDKFLIPEAEIQTDKVYGTFDLAKLEDASEY